MSDSPRHKSAGHPPVSAHPAFPVIVALWFAALLGIGSLVLPIEMFERFAVASGLSEVYQAAQPPLGATARIAVGIAASVIGALAGLFIARRIGAANTPKTVTRRAAALRPSSEPATMFAKRPISAHEELGEGGLDADEDIVTPPVIKSGRRRALAVTEESAPSEFLDFAPLPGQRAQAFDEPLDLAAFGAAEPESHAEPEKVEDMPPAELAQTGFGSATLSAPPSAFNVPATAFGQAGPYIRNVETPIPPVDPQYTAATEPLHERALGDLGIVELVERFAQALQRRRQQAEQPAEAMAAPPAEIDVFASAHDAPSTLTLVTETATFDRPQVVASELSMVPEPEAPTVSIIPAALRPIAFEDEQDDDESDLPYPDLTSALSQGRGPFAAPGARLAGVADIAAEHDDGAEDESDEDPHEEDYTSLLAMKNPFGLPREPVRIEDEPEDEGDQPVVVFPGQAARRAAPEGPPRDAVAAAAEAPRPFDAPLARAEQAAAKVRPSFGQPAGHKRPDAGATELALRDALEKLQKMSGAA